MRKRAIRIGLSLVGLTGLLLILLQTSFFQQWLLRRFENFATAAGYTISAGRLNLNLWQLQGTFHNLNFDDRKGMRIAASRLTFDVPWNAFDSPVVIIENLDIQGLTIDIDSPEPAIPEPSGSDTEAPRIRIDRLLIRDGRLTYKNQSTVVRLPSFAIDAANGRGTIKLGEPVTISPDLKAVISDIPFTMSETGVNIAATRWRIEHPELTGEGETRGSVVWSPALAVNLEYATDPLTYGQWRGIRSTGGINLENGVLRLTNFRATHAEGQLTGAATISDNEKSLSLLWSNLNLSPAGFDGTSEGNVDLRWRASDFSDAAGQGSIVVHSREYGRLRGNLSVKEARATIAATATGYDAVVRANVTSGLDQSLSGTFEATHKRYGLAKLNGTLGGTLRDPAAKALLTLRDVSYQGIGPLDASASVSLVGKMLTISQIESRRRNTNLVSGTASLDLQTRRIAGRIPEMNVSLADFVTDASGIVKAAVVLEGTWDRPKAALTAASDGFVIGGTRIDRAELEGQLDGEQFRVVRLSARQDPFPGSVPNSPAGEPAVLNLSGAYNTATKRIDGAAKVTNFAIADVRDFSGTATVDMRIGGTTLSPDLEFDGSIRGMVYQGGEHGDLTVSGTTQRETANIRFSADRYKASGTASVRLRPPYLFNASMTAADSHVQYEKYDAVVSGTLNASGQIDPFRADDIRFENFRVRGEGVDLSATGSLSSGARIEAVAEFGQFPVEGAELRGTARIEAVVAGTLEDPNVEGTIRTTNARLRMQGMQSFADLRTALRFSQDRFTIEELHAFYEGATADVVGDGTIKGTGDFQFRVENLRPERLLPERRSSGLISVEGSVEVRSPDLEGISGQARFTQLDLNLRDIPIRQVQPVEITLDRNQLLTVRNFVLEGLNTRTAVTGNANLRTKALNLDIESDTDLRIIEPFIPESTVLGRAQTRLSVRGSLERPNLEGYLNVRGMQVQIAEPPITVTDTNAEVRMQGERMELRSASGTLNGGAFTASGGTGVSISGLRDAAIHFEAQRFQMEYPEGLQSEISMQIDVRGSGSELQITGNVDILNAIYSQDIDLSEEIFTRITSESSPPIAAGRRNRSMIDGIGLNLTVGTPGLVTVANNVANLDLEGSFRVRGTVGSPIILGRAAAFEGGELYFGPSIARQTGSTTERRDRYVVEQGEIEFNNALRTEPAFNFVATHELTAKDERYLVTLRVTGTAAALRTELTSDPYLAEQDIMAMLLTGRTFTELQSAPVNVAGEQLAGYLSGQVGGYFQQVGSALGLDTVRIEPVLLAEQEDLSARLTIGKDITKDFSLVYSQNLAGPRSQSWIANYQAYKNFVLRGINESENNTIRTELRHDLRFGGGPPLPERVKPADEAIVGEVRFSGATFPEKDLAKMVTSPGKPFNTYQMNEDVRGLRKFYTTRDFLDVKIRADRTPRAGKVDVLFAIEEGPRVAFTYAGANVPRRVQEDIRQIWAGAFSEGPALRDSEDRLLRHFRDEGYLEVKVTSRIVHPSGSARDYLFEVNPGRKYPKPTWVIKGLEGIEIALPQDAGAVMADTSAIQEQIRLECQKLGYMRATSTVPQLVIDGDLARFEVSVETGPQYSIGEVQPPAKGHTAPFTLAWLEETRRQLIMEYWSRGYNDVQVIPVTTLDDDSAEVNVEFRVDPGPQQTISEIRVRGANVTNMDYVRRHFNFKQGDPVDYSLINLTRKRLYDTNLFKRVEIRMVPGPQGYIADVDLNESAPWQVRYGFAVGNRLQTSDRELGITTNVSYGNLFGRGVTTGLSARGDRLEREGRVFTSFPTFFGRDVRTTGSVFRIRDATQASEEGFLNNLWGFTVQQQWRLKTRYLFSYDYSFKRNDSQNLRYDPDDPFALEHIIFNIARLNATLSKDTRDDILDAKRGSFISNAFEIAPPGVGSSIKFMRNYAQYFRFREIRENWVWANALRVGIAKGFSGQDLIPTEQFTAGGATTLRAFKQDRLTTPGNSLLVLNTELRVPLFWRLGGVGFLDVGNVYPTIRELNLFASRSGEGEPVFRYSPGVGLRVRTPFVLIRVDLGLNLFARAGEPPRRWAFGIGQAF